MPVNSCLSFDTTFSKNTAIADTSEIDILPALAVKNRRIENFVVANDEAATARDLTVVYYDENGVPIPLFTKSIPAQSGITVALLDFIGQIPAFAKQINSQGVPYINVPPLAKLTGKISGITAGKKITTHISGLAEK